LFDNQGDAESAKEQAAEHLSLDILTTADFSDADIIFTSEDRRRLLLQLRQNFQIIVQSYAISHDMHSDRPEYEAFWRNQMVKFHL
jgi:hypothetical protein